MSWCLQCGSSGKPERAVGVDEDGEPACTFHRVKEIGSGLNAARALQTPVPLPVQLQPAAAPSPVQTSAVEESKMTTYAPRPCACGCERSFTPTGARSMYIDGHRPGSAGKPRKPKADKPRVESAVPQNGSGAAQATFGSNRFTVTQLDILWAVFSPEAKAEAIDRLLSYAKL